MHGSLQRYLLEVTDSALLSNSLHGVPVRTTLLYVTTLYERVDLIIQLWNRHEL